jgi:hypothetical protein
MDRITVAEAADRLGVTRDAVRKRVKRGRIKWDSNPDGEVFVYVDTSATSEDASATNRDMSEDTSGHEGSTALVESLQDQVEYLRREVEVWQDEARRKDHLLAAALERIPAIEAPPDTLNPNGSPEPRGAALRDAETGDGSGAPDAESGRHRGFWRRFFGL